MQNVQWKLDRTRDIKLPLGSFTNRFRANISLLFVKDEKKGSRNELQAVRTSTGHAAQRKTAYVPCLNPFIETAHSFRWEKGMMKVVSSESRNDYYLCHVCPSLHLSAWNITKSTGRSFVIFHIKDFNYIFWRIKI